VYTSEEEGLGRAYFEHVMRGRSTVENNVDERNSRFIKIPLKIKCAGGLDLGYKNRRSTGLSSPRRVNQMTGAEARVRVRVWRFEN